HGFFDKALLVKAIQNGVDGREGITLFGQASTKLVKFLSNVASRESIVGCGHDPFNILRDGGVYDFAQPSMGVIVEIDFLALVLGDQLRKRVHALAQRKNAS